MTHRPYAAAARTTLPVLMALLMTLLTAVLPPAARAADKDSAQSDGFSAGLSVRKLDSAAQTGLPVYPGAQPLRDKDDDSAGASVGLWGGAFGFQLHALKLQSRDPVPAVAAFYREALSREGALMDCSQPQPEPARGPDSNKDSLLRCGSDKPAPGGQLFKVGTPKRVRIVTLEPSAGGTRIQLVRVELRAD